MKRLIWTALAIALAPSLGAAETVVDAKVYDRAAEFLSDKLKTYILNASITPHWRGGARERLTYVKDLGDGRSAFVQVDAATGKPSPAFDQGVVAAGLTKALGKPVDGAKLPFTDYDELSGAIRFDA